MNNLKWCFVLLFVQAECLFAEQAIDNYFLLSPAELAAIPISVASGSSRTVSQSAAIVTVITADQITAMGASQLHQVLETVPGVHVSFDQRSSAHFYSMRGIRNENSAQVLILLDGTRVSLPYRGGRVAGFTMPTENIARLEVIRGPGSAIYGADAFAGVINIISKKADDINGIRVGGRAASWDSYEGWAQYGDRWQEWDVALSFQYQTSEGDNSRIIASDLQTQLDVIHGTSASLAPGTIASDYDRWNAHASFQRKHWALHFWGSEQLQGGTGVGVNSILDPRGNQESQQYLADLRYSTEDLFKDWQFEVKASYLYSAFESTFHLFPDGALLSVGGDGNPSFVDPVGLVLFPNGVIGVPGREYHMPSLEFVSKYHGWEDHLLRVAMGYRYESISTTETKNFGPGVINGTEGIVNGTLTDVTDTDNVYLPDDHRSIWSISIQDEWSITDDLLLTLGVRNDYYTDFGNTVNPRASLVWGVNDQLTAKLLYGRAFRAPSFTEQGNQNNPVILGNSDLDAETIDTVEIAFDYIPYEQLHTSINLFYYQLENRIMFAPDPGESTSTAQNIGDVEGYGLEFEWQWQIIDELRLLGNVAWQQSRTIQYNDETHAVPSVQLYSALNWAFYPNWFIQPQINWVGSRTRAATDPRQKLDDYAIVDLVLGTKNLMGHIDINAAVKNLFNQDAREDGSPRLPSDIPLPERSFQIDFSVNF